MFRIQYILILLLPLYLLGSEDTFKDNTLSNQDEFIDILTVDPDSLMRFWASIQVQNSYNPSELEDEFNLRELPFDDVFSQEAFLTSTFSPSASPLPVETLSPVVAPATPLLRPDGKPYIRGPYNTKTKRIIEGRSSYEGIKTSSNTDQESASSTKRRKNTQRTSPVMQQFRPKSNKGKRYTKRNINPGVPSNHPEYHKKYSALYARSLLRKDSSPENPPIRPIKRTRINKDGTMFLLPSANSSTF